MNLVNEQNGFLKHNDIIILESNEKTSKVKMNISENSLNPYDIVHGGLIYSMGDTVMGITIRSTGRDAVTLDGTINYLKPGKGKYLIATSEVIKVGKTTSVLMANIYNDKEELIAVMSATYYFII